MEAVISFIVILGILVFVHELGHFITAKLAGVKVEEFGFGFPPRIAAFRRGETEYSINWVPLGGFVRMLGEEDPEAPRSFAAAPKRWRSVILLAGATMNLVAAIFFFAGGYMSGAPVADQVRVQVMSVVPGSPAETAGVRANDQVISIDGRQIENVMVLQEVTRSALGREVEIVVSRGEEHLALRVTPNLNWQEGKGALGVSIANRAVTFKQVYYPLGAALHKGATTVTDTVRLTLTLPVMVVRGLIPADLARPVGPAGIFQVTSQAATETAETGWWFPILFTAGYLSVGLGIANLLPIPGLDSGRLILVVLEAIRGQRVRPEREGFIHMLGIAFMLSLVVVISFFDVTTPIPQIDWGIR